MVQQHTRRRHAQAQPDRFRPKQNSRRMGTKVNAQSLGAVPRSEAVGEVPPPRQAPVPSSLPLELAPARSPALRRGPTPQQTREATSPLPLGPLPVSSQLGLPLQSLLIRPQAASSGHVGRHPDHQPLFLHSHAVLSSSLSAAPSV